MEPASQSPPPYITPELPGVGGNIKERPEHFVVSEIPLYLPEGAGDHIYLTLRRSGMNTRDLQSALARLFDLPAAAVGMAGLKDKDAIATQTFSLNLRDGDPERAAALVQAELPVQVLSVGRHRNKLRTGHLLGNRFEILLSGPGPEALGQAQEIARAIIRRGLPNYFGEQRFGKKGDNAAQGREALRGRGPRQKWLRKLVLSAFQSELFNIWLARRVADGLFRELLPGDIAKKYDTGGLFEVEDARAETARLLSGEISHTGPIYGSKMRWAGGQAAERERQVLTESGVDDKALAKAGLKGTRRRGRLLLDDLAIRREEAGLWFSFSLPKGSYATTLLREFIKPH